jgi:hypothetical protein
VEPLLNLASELERRDAVVAEQLVRVEQMQAEVEEVRAHGVALRDYLAALPGVIADFTREEEAAEDARVAARAALREAEALKDEAVRNHAVQRAHGALLDADRRAQRAREQQQALADEGAVRRAEAVGLYARAGVADLDAVLAWASHRRGALLVERSNLAREREAIVREASELLGSVLGDPLVATSVAGLRERLERAGP